MIYENIEVHGYLPRSCVRIFSPNTKHLELARTLSTSSASVGQYIKTLELKGVEPEQAIAEQILEHTTSLKTFVYQFEVQCNYDGLGTWPNAQTLTRALANVGQTLEHLEVTHQFQSDLFGLMGPFFPPRALIFKELVVLKSLSVTLSLLLGWRPDSTTRLAETLPSGLVRLSIEYSPQMPEDCQWQAEDVLRVLEEFVAGKRWMKTTPHLDSITLNDTIWSPDKGQQEKTRKAAKDMFEQNGLQCFASRVGVWDWEDDDDLYI
ncbi:hypothetical protein HBI56_151370 [Parastagonospora nodorum]|uniref:Uncharacterized protein n=1 Tax=Phaeosphaeria nodorum (strain SN15 / ATCC MYA-4574 / FGSC 10173) TaxID=321614 RepID=A0A7U2I8B5_PHANO|nr:hypothetical protein HBH56_183150 [Parastagonospora nodorum]QRD04158.1 hypothetical protein JI435_128910 [Parastagonospora nodorum SN15]KAH3926118.1 hypothetical protein HBH54_172300 [Parastagonospora nodorum]KAH3944735.1 hypothetical protein HBH53_152620 [Parastagonospora nodorum]KAH3962497.1 hypothetical protein HBH52_223800 [Parastagonospora nodorum]